MIFHIAKLPLEFCSVLQLKIDQSFESRSSAPYAAQQKLARALLDNSDLSGICVSTPRDLSTLIMIAANDSYLQSSRTFLNFCRSERVSISSAYSPPDRSSVEQCLRFTICHFMGSERWYRVGDALIPDVFLHGIKEDIPRIEFQLHPTSSGEVYMKIFPDVVRMYVMEEWQLGKGIEFEERWVNVLPKLGRGRVVGVHKALPIHSPFANYAEIRTYWRHCYGYLLPSRQPDCYYDIKFNGMKDTFLYPYFCVLSNQPQAIYVRNMEEKHEEVLESFLSALSNAFNGKNICGANINVRSTEGEDIRLTCAVTSLPPTKKRNLPKIGSFRPQIASSVVRRPIEENHNKLERVRNGEMTERKKNEERTGMEGGTVFAIPRVPVERYKPSFTPNRLLMGHTQVIFPSPMSSPSTVSSLRIPSDDPALPSRSKPTFSISRPRVSLPPVSHTKVINGKVTKLPKENIPKEKRVREVKRIKTLSKDGITNGPLRKPRKVPMLVG